MSDSTEVEIQAGAPKELQAPADLRPLSNRSMFWRPMYLAPSAWTEHLPFAFWLIEAHRPRVFIELGTHFGTSYFGFCQAVDRLNLDTKCFAVDTWKGDEHAGEYDETVYNQVEAHNDAHYSGFSRLVRSTFDEALQYFSDGTVDLLHIDGLHTLEAVTHDFESWLPKLSPRAIVVFHDINVRERGFGVFKLFEQLATRYPAFEFVHGHGLGVVGVGPDSAAHESVGQLFQANTDPARQRAVREVFSRLGRAWGDAFKVREGRDAKEQAATLHKALTEVRAKLEARVDELGDVRGRLNALSEKYASERGQWVDRLSGEQSRSAELVEENTRLRQELQDMARQFQPALDSSRQGQVREVDLERRQERIDALSEALAVAKEQLLGRERENEELSSRLVQREQQLVQVQALLRDEGSSTKSLAQDLAEAKERLAGRDHEIAELSTRLAQCERQLEHAHAGRREAESNVGESTRQLAQQRKDFAALGEQMRQRETAFDDLRAQSAQRIEELSAAGAAEKRRGEALARKLAESLTCWEARLTEREEEVSRLTAESDRLRQHVVGLERELDQARRQLEAFSQSRSWRLTAPLRWAARPFSGGSAAAMQHEDRSHDLVELLAGSGYFEREWYLTQYPDVARSGADPIEHYLECGAKEGRDPSPRFCTRAYLGRYRDVRETEINPLVHFLRFGLEEGRRPDADGPVAGMSPPESGNPEERG